MKLSDAPNLSCGCRTKKDVRAIVQLWACQWGFKPTAFRGGGDNLYKMRCNHGGVVARKKAIAKQGTARSSTTLAAPTLALRCPFQLVAKLGKGTKEWTIRHLHYEHNHAPKSKPVGDHINRVADLTEEQLNFLQNISLGSMGPRDMLDCFRLFFPDAPPLTT